MNSYINTWRDATSAFKQQLQRNMYELSGNYPPNWQHFITRIPQHITKVIDIGCGAGSLCKLLQIHFPNIEYYGYDYSPQAIELAINTWGTNNFAVKKYQDLTSELFDDNTMLVANALIDVLPDGDQCLDFLLQLDVKNIHLQRVRITYDKSYYEVYQAYDIMTYSYFHNYKNLLTLFAKFNYQYTIDNYSNDILDILLIK